MARKSIAKRTSASDQPASRDAWIRVGLSVLARDGIEAVRVEPLAVRIGVTKGSFYWHFKDRAALHAAMLETWRASTTREVVERLEAEAGPPADRLRRLIELTTSNGKVAGLETAIRSWAQNDAAVAKAVAVIDDERIDYVAGLLRQIGVESAAAMLRAKALYLMLIGSFFAAKSEKLQSGPALWREIARLIT